MNQGPSYVFETARHARLVVIVGQAGLPTSCRSAVPIVNRITVNRGSRDAYGVLEAGASVAITPRVSAQVQALGTIEQPDGNDYGGFAGLKFAF